MNYNTHLNHNYAIYNAPGGTLNFNSNYPSQYDYTRGINIEEEKETETETRTGYQSSDAPDSIDNKMRCRRCHKRLGSESRTRQHYKDYPHHCPHHDMCFNSWRKHMKEYMHTQCPLPGCAEGDIDFRTEERFMRHWQKRHC